MKNKQDSPDMREEIKTVLILMTQIAWAFKKAHIESEEFELYWEDYTDQIIRLYAGKFDEFYTAGFLASPTARQAYDKGEKAGKVLGVKKANSEMGKRLMNILVAKGIVRQDATPTYSELLMAVDTALKGDTQ